MEYVTEYWVETYIKERSLEDNDNALNKITIRYELPTREDGDEKLTFWLGQAVRAVMLLNRSNETWGGQK